ncbi:hypothetical protein [Haloarchaeobius sp. HME9146]|uniref:hypothetical protein n=1 Tax=Haloarchaeobius sp. HME9146 TaxID=2978732 RepID=UPI0021C0AF49|nr:hypothetical protein [Haloarchaeobius sp. HME9146]MCT9097579.1 hypothetical protein [Haloarchaeobius sp. HME9146]
MSDDGDDAPLSDLRDEVVDDGDDDAADETETEVRAELVDGDGDDESTPAIPGESLDTDDGPTVRSGPLSDMAEDLEERRRDGDAADDDLFESVDVGEVDADELWDQVDTDGPTIDPEPDREEVRTIKKSKYCQRCEYFADPPEVACHHEGTTIRKEADMEHFEVADCPKVLEDERLENA